MYFWASHYKSLSSLNCQAHFNFLLVMRKGVLFCDRAEGTFRRRNVIKTWNNKYDLHFLSNSFVVVVLPFSGVFNLCFGGKRKSFKNKSCVFFLFDSIPALFLSLIHKHVICLGIQLELCLPKEMILCNRFVSRRLLNYHIVEGINNLWNIFNLFSYLRCSFYLLFISGCPWFVKSSEKNSLYKFTDHRNVK